MAAYTWNEQAIVETLGDAASILNAAAASAVRVAKNTPGKYPARGAPGRNAPYQTGTYQRGIRLGELATAQKLEASLGVYGVRYAQDIEREGAYGRPWRGKNNLRDAVEIALRDADLLR